MLNTTAPLVVEAPWPSATAGPEALAPIDKLCLVEPIFTRTSVNNYRQSLYPKRTGPSSDTSTKVGLKLRIKSKVCLESISSLNLVFPKYLPQCGGISYLHCYCGGLSEKFAIGELTKGRFHGRRAHLLAAAMHDNTGEMAGCRRPWTIGRYSVPTI